MQYVRVGDLGRNISELCIFNKYVCEVRVDLSLCLSVSLSLSLSHAHIAL